MESQINDNIGLNGIFTYIYIYTNHIDFYKWIERLLISISI